MGSADLFGVLSPKFSRAAYDMALKQPLEALTREQEATCIQCIKYLLADKPGDPNLPILLGKFGIRKE